MAVAGVNIANTAIDLIAFCNKERLFMIGNGLKEVMIDQQSGKQHAKMNQGKAEGFTRQFV